MALDDVEDGLLDLVFLLMMPNRSPFVRSGGVDGNGEMGSSYYGGLLSNHRGLLIYGPPGCGKTSLVRALACTANSRVLCVTPSTLMRKYVGETELQVRALFSLARKLSPCIIFIDEVDGLFRERGGGVGGTGGGEHDVSRDLKTEFMQLWDGIRSKKSAGSSGSANDQVLIIGATNRPFDVDPGFLRRMPRSFFVGLPDRAGRVAVLRSMLRNVPLGPDFHVEAVADRTEFYAPSDLREVLRTAALVPLREARFRALKEAQEGAQRKDGGMGGEDASVGPKPLGAVPVLRALTTDDVLGALSKVAPTQLSSAYVGALTEYANRAGGIRSSGPSPMAFGENEIGRPSGRSTRPYQHPSGYYVHKAGDGTFFTDAGTIFPGGHDPHGLGGAMTFEDDDEDGLSYDSSYHMSDEGESDSTSSDSSSSYDDDSDEL